MKRILILGGTGMLGHTLLGFLSKSEKYEVYATVRSVSDVDKYIPLEFKKNIRTGVEVDNFDTVVRAIAAIQPDIIINCIGIIKQLGESKDPLTAITVNAQLPHRLSMLCRAANCRFVHISTDCVFSGEKSGGYSENDFPDANDLYGRTKLLGEVTYPHCVTIRTSIIGHEQKGFHSLVDWFLGQVDQHRDVYGFSKAFFSGFPTIELAHILQDYVLGNNELHGVYHVSSAPISKYDLLKMISVQYGMKVNIEVDDSLIIDRSLISTRFRKDTGYEPPSWKELIGMMYHDYSCSPFYFK